MKRIGLPAVLAVACFQAIFLLSGCGGSSSGGGGGTTLQQPYVTSFSPGAAAIEVGSSTTLTAVFGNGSGVITATGGFSQSVTSGSAVTVSPTTTTTYTLTVMGASGTTPATSNTTVTVDPVPTISAFSAAATTIEATTSTTLTATFAGGTGVITPGNLAITSGGNVTVTPATTTTYTLTVTPPAGSINATTTATVTVVPVPTAALSASSSEIEAGSSTILTATFSGGASTGTITAPGGYSANVTSGQTVTVSPATTTIYTLSVSSAVGTIPGTATASVKVDPVPTITSFSANPTNVTTAGGSSTLTAVFSGGTGVVTAPGGFNQSVTSGVGLTVNPNATTTYTLTVSPPATCTGCATATQTTTVTVGTATISSFTSNPTQIEAGSSTNVIGVFSGGTGVITPGNYTVTSGQAQSVSPTATTQYTLTVTPTGGGTAVTANTTVTVYPQPTITSFTANSTTIVAGGSGAQLTAVFSGGTGTMNPGNIAMTSGTAVTVHPTSTTTYTLTVTPPVGTVNATQTLTITVNTGVTVCTTPSCSLPQISSHLLGMNLAMWWDDITNASSVLAAFQKAGITAVRWPGGSNSDFYHWNGTATYPTIAAATNCNGGYSVPDDTFANFETDIVQPGNLDLAVTADYGSDPACTGPGQPSEAASWAAAAVADGTPIHYMTIGNEQYGSWEYDLHTPAANQHNPTVYASEMVGATGFYQSIKTAVENAGGTSSTTLVGVVVDAGSTQAGWDSTVLANAKGSYDFVEYHYYPQYGNVTSDTYLVQQAALDFTTDITKLQSELATAGVSDTPIYVGEIGANSSNPGTQSWSITQGLYAGQVLGEAMNDGVARLTWWIGFGNCLGAGNNSASLYGWQNTWGAYNVFSDGSTDGGSCPGEGNIGTMSPTAEAFNLFQNVAVNGEYPQKTSVTGDTTNVRAYAATHGTGYALMLFNLNQTTSETVSVSVGSVSTSTDVQVITYDKAIYDQTDNTTPVWAAPTTTDMGAQTLPLTLTLQPWSMNVVIVK